DAARDVIHIAAVGVGAADGAAHPAADRIADPAARGLAGGASGRAADVAADRAADGAARRPGVEPRSARALTPLRCAAAGRTARCRGAARAGYNPRVMSPRAAGPPRRRLALARNAARPTLSHLPIDSS